MSFPAVTVLVPTYERREPVRRAVASALAQTRQDFEIVVVDDGSTDGTAEALAGIDPRLTLVRQPNRGCAAARNTGLRHSRAPVVAFLDSDNLWLPDHLETVLGMLERHPEAVLASTTPDFLVTGREPVSATEVRDALPGAVRGNAIGFVSSIAVRREALERVGGFDEELRVLEDTDMWVKLATLGPFAFLRRRTMVRIDSPDSLMGWGHRTGAYLAGMERHGERAAALLAAEPRTRAMADRARGTAEVARALRALDAGDDAGTRAAIARACALQPDLDDHAGLTAYRVRSHLPSVQSPATAADAHLRLAWAWPDPEGLTAHWLRLEALRWAVLARDRGLAVAALRGWPRSGTRRLVGSLAGHARWRARKKVQDVVAVRRGALA